jgi:hypothetical protein
MNTVRLSRGIYLRDLIEETSRALKHINDAIARFEKSKDHWRYLYLSQHEDGSGAIANLKRPEGNREIVIAARDILERQLTEFQKEFEAL